ncbi:MAG: ATP-binding protein [Nanohaloarchaea archaeon SW_7_43_1]|nr:MAG: ATP-binding protein [Nanohaloarchaea archaeon SW_7_43_1]
MCSISGAEEEKLVERLIQCTEHRGDSPSLEKVEDLCLGHVLHSIVGEVSQPLGNEGLISANCEIYNWKELREKYGLEAENDAELLLKMLDREGLDALQELDGIYAFAYLKDQELVIARDVTGVNPVWYSKEPFVFCSEKQALEKNEIECRELHPRRILKYNIETSEISFKNREFFEIDVGERKSIDERAEEIKELFLKSVEKRVPEEEDVALLFSGGVDSTMVAAALQELGIGFTAYTAGIQYGNIDAPRDVKWAEEIADEMDIDLEVHESNLEEVEESLREITEWISSSSTVKNGVALPFHLSLQQTDEKVVMSGLGSEQLYAGYHRQQGYLNKECLSGLRGIFERDLYRDNVISFRNGCELRVPFLDHSLIEHALTVPEDYKVNEEYRKLVLRNAAEKLGVPEKVVWRNKTAAQYGSNFDKAINRLAKNNSFDLKQKYLNSLRDKSNNRLVALTSGGKDSNAALYRMKRRNNDISCLLTLRSENKDSYMFDSKKKRKDLEWQSEQLDTPLIIQETKGQKEEELEDLKKGLERAINEYNVEVVVAGALASTYQRDRVEKIAEELGLKVFAPLWQEYQENYMKWLVREGFQVEITDVAARGLEKSWEGKVLDQESVDKLIELSQEYGFNPAGEGGEYETKVVGFPSSMFSDK